MQTGVWPAVTRIGSSEPSPTSPNFVQEIFISDSDLKTVPYDTDFMTLTIVVWLCKEDGKIWTKKNWNVVEQYIAEMVGFVQ